MVLGISDGVCKFVATFACLTVTGIILYLQQQQRSSHSLANHHTLSASCSSPSSSFDSSGSKYDAVDHTYLHRSDWDFDQLRLLSSRYELASDHGWRVRKQDMEAIAKLEAIRPKIPGVRVFGEPSGWKELPHELNKLQLASHLVDASGLPDRLAAQRANITATMTDSQWKRLHALQDCIDKYLVQGDWTNRSDLTSWKWSDEALSHCPFRLMTNEEIRKLYAGQSVVVVGDSMGREIFYSIVRPVSSRPTEISNKWDTHYKVDSRANPLDYAWPPIRLELWRANLAVQLAHTLDGIYYRQILEREFGRGDPPRKLTEEAIRDACALPRVKRLWMACPLAKQKISPSFYVLNSAAWEPRGFWGMYGYQWNMRDWKRYLDEEYAVHVRRALERICAYRTPSLVLWRTPNYVNDTYWNSHYDGDARYDSFLSDLSQTAMKVIQTLRTERHCHNLFLYNLHPVTKLQPTWTEDGRHYQTLIPFFSQLTANAYRLYFDTTWTPKV